MDFLKKVRDQPLEDVIKIFHGLQDYTALKAAVTCEREDVVKLLLEKNCIVNQNIDTPLHIAVRLGSIKCIQMLLEKKASITIVNSNGDTPLHIAFQNNEMEIVDLLLDTIEQTSDYLNIKNKQDLTHLHIALARTKKTVVEGFVAAATNMIKVVNNYSAYQKLQSIKNIKFEEVKQETIELSPEVISQPASNFKLPVAAENSSLSLPSVKREDNGHEENLESYQNISNAAEFHTVCSEGYPDIVRDYLQAGWNVNTPLKDLGSTPLHCAVEECQLENAKVLLEYGADPMLIDANRATPLHICLYNNDTVEDGQILKLLYGATTNKSTNLKDKNGMSFLHVAASMNDLQTVQRYLHQGEDVNQKIQGCNYVSFYTPLHFAVKYRHQEMVKLLIERGADVNSDDIESPLHLACKLGHQGIIELLLEKGAMANRPCKYKTPLHLLVEYVAQHRWTKVNAGDCENEKTIFRKDYRRKVDLVNSCFHKLIDAGCNINAKDANGNTALHYTCATKTYNRISMLRLLQLGADINVENEEGKTPMEVRDLNWYCGVIDDLMLLYHHVQELKALGMMVNYKNEVYCKKIMEKRAEWSKHENWKLNGKLLSDEELDARNKQRLNEIEKMKQVMLTKKTSLYKFLTSEFKSHYVSAKNQTLVTILEEIVTEKGYPVYGNRIWLRWKKIPEIFHSTNESKRKGTFEATGNSSDIYSKRSCI